MPSGKIHMTAGALAGSFVMYHLGGPPTLVIAGAFGGLLPDIDHHASQLGRFTPLHFFFKHRGFTHSLLAWAIVGWLGVIYLPGDTGIALSMGYLSHLILDFRVPWLWPNHRKKKKRRR